MAPFDSVRFCAKIRSLALLIVLANGFCLSAAAQNAAAEMSWHNLSTISVEGKGWATTTSLYDRLPAKAEGGVGLRCGISRSILTACVTGL